MKRLAYFKLFVFPLLILSGCAESPLLREAPESAEGAHALEAQDPMSARLAYEELERAYPGGPDIALALGVVALDEGNDEEAIQRAKGALADEPIDSRLASTVDPLFRWALKARDEALRRSLDERGGRAHHNVGMVHLERGIGERNAGKGDEAREAFEAAIEAFERSLLSRPGDRDTAFNLELALLLRDEAEAMEPPPQEDEQDEQDDSESQKDDDQEEGEGRDDEQDDESEEPSQDQDQDQGEQQESDADGEPDDERDETSDGNQEGNEGQEERDSETGEPEEDELSQEIDQEEADAEPEEREAEHAQAEHDIEAKSRDEAERLLRALEASDESLESHLSRRRASRSRRFVEKDW